MPGSICHYEVHHLRAVRDVEAWGQPAGDRDPFNGRALFAFPTRFLQLAAQAAFYQRADGGPMFGRVLLDGDKEFVGQFNRRLHTQEPILPYLWVPLLDPIHLTSWRLDDVQDFTA